MFAHIPPKERLVYVLIGSLFAFGAGYSGVRYLRRPPDIIIQGLSAPDTLPPAPVSKSLGGDNSTLRVTLEGHVKRPGQVSMPKGSTVLDALKAIGGPTLDADLSGVDVHAPVKDGELIQIDGVDSTSAPVRSGQHRSKRKRPEHPIDLNAATVEQIEQLPGIGPAMAQKIVDFRSRHGALSSLEDLRAIRGIGDRKLEALRPFVLPLNTRQVP